MRAGTCKSCKAAIVWIRTQEGKSMPCDAAPVYYTAKPKSGSKRIVTPNGEVLACEYTQDPHRATGTGFVPHWATCPRRTVSEESKERLNRRRNDLWRWSIATRR